MISPSSIALNESRTRFGTDGKARLARSIKKLRSNSPIGKWTSIGWIGCRSGLPSRKSFDFSILLRWEIGASRLRDLAPFIFRHPCDADAVVVSYSSTQIGGGNQYCRSQDRQCQRRRRYD